MPAEEKKITRLFHKACADFALLEDGDRVLVALSGGKDSLMLTRLMARQARILKPRIQVEAAHVVMDNIPYASDHDYLQEFCQTEGIPFHILHTSFDASTDHRHTPCFLCSWNRRKLLFSFARDNGFNKVALGHHQDDFLVTMLLNLTFEGSFSSMTPLMAMRHYPISVIRPMCLVPEHLITHVAETECFRKQTVLCPYDHETQRTKMTAQLRQLEQLNPEARYSMWHALSSTF